jgi:8-oxo-dGTP pyrophosphatase MutT (NUDIX family)
MAPIKISKLTKDLVVRFSGKAVALPENVQRDIDRYWNGLMAVGRPYRRGEVFTVTRKEETEGVIEVLVEGTDYAHYLYSQNVGGLGEYATRVIHTSALAFSSDGYVIFGEMGKQTSQAGIFQCCGGGIDNDDLRGDVFDFDHNIAKELREELGIDVSDTERVVGFGKAYFKEGGPRDAMTVVYRVDLAETAEEFMRRYQAFVDDLLAQGELPEFGELVVLSFERNAFGEFFEKRRERCDEYMEPLFNFLLEEGRP